MVADDEQPLKANLDAIPQLRPAFSKDGTVTAANSSSISDGAAAMVLMKLSEAERRGIAPLARIAGYATHSQEPQWFTTAPVGAIRKLFEKTGWDAKTTDLFEINEAFAVVAMAAMHDLGLPHEQGERARRRVRAGPSARRVRRAHHGDAARGAGKVRR